MTAIDSPITREDLLSRAIILDVPAISEAERVPSEEIDDEFERARPTLLGAIFDGVSAALRNLPNTHLDELPRLADFIKFTTAAERCFGSDGAVLRAFKANQRTANESLADLSPVVKAIRELLKAEKGTWSGNTHQLYGALHGRCPNERVFESDEWPKNARALSASLKYLKPVLAGIGIDCAQRRDNTGSTVKLTLIA
jgi:putative DNA primase/helicase